MSTNRTLAGARPHGKEVLLNICTPGFTVTHDITPEQAYNLARELVAAADDATGNPWSDEIGFVRWHRGQPDDLYSGQLLSTVLTVDGRVTDVDEVVECTAHGRDYLGFTYSDNAHTVAWAFLPEPAKWIADPVDEED